MTGPAVTGAVAAARPVVLSLGSNLGDRLANLQRAIDLLGDERLRVTAVSGVYQTAPVGGPAQADYLNAVLLAQSALAGPEILRRCLAAEAALGRVRLERWGPRTLDVDVIAIGDELSTDPPADPALILPHPRARERAFVLAPWLEVAPDARLPGGGAVADLLAAVTTAGVTRLPGIRLALPAASGPAAGPAASGPAGARPAPADPAGAGAAG